MISNWLFIVLIILLSMVAYFIGLKRGITGSQHLYDDGWLDCEEHMRQYYEVEDDEEKYNKARKMIRELDELFNEEDEEEIIGGDEY